MIKCRGCGALKEGDPCSGADIHRDGWKLVIAQDQEVGFIALCPSCKEKVVLLANSITEIVKAKYIYLYTLTEK